MQVRLFESDVTRNPRRLGERIKAVASQVEAEGKGVLDVQVSDPPHDRDRDPQAVHLIVTQGTPRMPDNPGKN